MDIPAGGWRIHSIDPDLITNNSPGSAVPMSIQLTADRPFRVLSAFGSGHSQDANPALPIHVLGTSYHVHAVTSSIYQGFIMIVATENGTEITVTPTVATTSGQLPGIPAYWTLEAGENLLLKSTEDLTGTLVTATAPVAVMGGHDGGYIPDSCVAADFVFHYSLPDYVLDTKYPIMPVPGRDFSLLQVIAIQDGTEVLWMGELFAVLNKGESVLSSFSEPGVLQANHPISALVFQVGSGCQDGYGDPAMIPILPWGVSSGRVDAMAYWLGYEEPEMARLDLVVDAVGLGTTIINGDTLSAADFSSLGFGTSWYVMDMDLEDWGSLYVSSAGTFAANVHGFGDYKSYGYPVGSSFLQATSTTLFWCPDNPLWLRVPTGGHVLTWSNGAVSDSIQITVPGTYWVEWSNGAECGVTNVYYVISAAPPASDVIGLEPFCPDLNEAIRLMLDVPAMHVVWSNGNTGDTSIYTETGNGWVAYSSEGSCWDSVFFLLERDCPPPPEPLDTLAGPVGFPNAFSPNNDGVNDSFGPMTLPEMNFAKFDMQIYNRWGRMVYATSTADQSWDGRIDGIPAEVGSYRYQVHYIDKQGNTQSLVGEFLLVR